MRTDAALVPARRWVRTRLPAGWPRTTTSELVIRRRTRWATASLTLKFDAAGGEIVSCLDRDGAEHAADGLNRLVVHRDPYQSGRSTPGTSRPDYVEHGARGRSR